MFGTQYWSRTTEPRSWARTLTTARSSAAPSSRAATARSCVGRPRPLQHFLECLNRLGEQLRPGHAAGWAAAEEVRLKGGEAIVARRDRLGDYLGDATLPLAGNDAVLLAGDPVL